MSDKKLVKWKIKDLDLWSLDKCNEAASIAYIKNLFSDIDSNIWSNVIIEYGGSDEYEVDLSLYGCRLETDKEFEQRIKEEEREKLKAEKQRLVLEANELRMLKKLKAKYEKTEK